VILKRRASVSSNPAVPVDAVQPVSVWLVIAAWTVPALLTTFETMMFSRSEGRPISLWRAFLGGASGWYVWAACTPLIARLARRFPLRLALYKPVSRPTRWRFIAIHVGAFVLVHLAASVVWATAATWVRPVRFAVALGNWFIAALPFAVLVYAAVVSIFYSLVDRAQLRVRERDAARLAQQLSEAQLASLRMQLRPHFLFNSLNAIMALVRDHDTGRAIHALSLLSDVLRATVNAGDAHETTLAAEVDFVTRYLRIEQVRFNERLQVRIDVADDLRDAKVPVFILQPFVENSLKHGVLQGRGANEIAISSHADATMLTLEVRDDGRGLSHAGTNGAGVGISNARRRLERMYGPEAALDVANAASAPGVVVRIRIPLNRSA